MSEASGTRGNGGDEVGLLLSDLALLRDRTADEIASEMTRRKMRRKPAVRSLRRTTWLSL